MIKRTVKASGVSLVLVLAFAASLNAAIFPANGEWISLTQSGSAINDPAQDASRTYLDIVGDSSNSAFLLSTNSDDLFFRIRLSATPYNTSTNRFAAYKFGVLFDTNNNIDNYEYALVLNAVTTPNVISVYSNTIVGSSWYNDEPEVLLNSGPAIYDTNARVQDAGTTFGGYANVFLDIAVPLTYFTGTEIDLKDSLSFAAFTGNGTFDDTAGFTDPLTAAPVPIPPTVYLLGSGLIGFAGLRRKFKK